MSRGNNKNLNAKASSIQDGNNAAAENKDKKDPKVENSTAGDQGGEGGSIGNTTPSIPSAGGDNSSNSAESTKEKTLKPKPSKDQKKAVEEANLLVAIMDTYKVNELFENSKGEVFTTENPALLSEKGKKDSVKTHRRDNLETLINTSQNA